MRGRSAFRIGFFVAFTVALTIGVLACLQVAAGAATTTCGQTAAGSTTVARAAMTAAPASATTDLGNDGGGDRQVSFDVSTDGQCALPSNVPVAVGILAGKFNDLDSQAAVTTSATVDGNLVHVVVTIHRAKVPAGSYTGTVRIGDGTIGATTAQLTVTRQAPLFWVPLLLGIIAMIGGIVLAGMRRLYEDGAKTPTPVANARAKSKANQDAAANVSVAKKFGASTWRSLLAVLLPIEAAIRVGSHLVANAFSAQHAWPVLVGLGAAITAFVATYSNDSSWAFSLPALVGLLSKVGGAALAASFATWQAADHAA